jgi:hypothetical protein
LSNWGVDTKFSRRNITLPNDLQDPELINNYFLNVAGHSTIDNNLLSYYSSNFFNQNSSFNFKEIGDDDILEAIKSIKSQATGYDGINIKMLSIVLPYCIKEIKNIFNESVNKGVFPKIWKIANVVPIPKIPTPAGHNDLRPVSILPTFSKVFEKIIANQMINYVEKHKIIPSIQSGFRKLHSTQTALLKVANDIATGFENSTPSVLVLLDQSKAFDLVNFKLLLAKLKYIGFSSTALTLLDSYLHNRFQRVILNGGSVCSSLNIVKCGVPQGSILGPLLFSLFIFDLLNCLIYVNVHLYADDIALYMSCEVNTLDNYINKFNSDLNNITTFLQRHGLRINPNKTVALCITSPVYRTRIVSNYSIIVDNTIINWVDSAKNLGVVMDSNFSFNDHVNHIYRVCFAKLKSLQSLKHDLNRDVKLMLVKSLIYPHIDYCCFVYFNFLSQQNKLKLQRLQNACFRFVCCIPYREHITPFRLSLNELNVHGRISYLNIVFLYKMLKSHSPSYLFNLITRRNGVHDINIRTNSFCIPRHTSNKFRGSFAYLAPFYLNSVLPHLHVSIYQFKQTLKNFVQQ